MSQGKAGEEGGAASSDVEAASPAETLTTFVFDTCSRLSATPEEAMPQGAGGAAWSDADSRLVTRMALQRLLELATGANRNLLRGLREATPARRVAPLGQFADVLLSSIDAIQQLASEAAEFRAPVEDSAAATSPRGSPEERPTLPPHRLLPAPATTTPGSAEWEHRVLEGQGPEAISSLRGGPLLEPLPEPLLRGDPQVGAPPGLVAAAAARPSRWARRRSSSSSSASPTEELGAEPLRWIIARSAAGGDDLSPPRREPRWTLARSRSPPRRREPRSSRRAAQTSRAQY